MLGVIMAQRLEVPCMLMSWLPGESHMPSRYQQVRAEELAGRRMLMTVWQQAVNVCSPRKAVPTLWRALVAHNNHIFAMHISTPPSLSIAAPFFDSCAEQK